MLAAALAACGPPPAPTPPAVKPSPVVKAPPPAVTAAPVSLPDFSLVARPAVAPVCAAPPAGEPGPIPGGFLEVTLPAQTPALVDVEGRDDRDVWFLPEWGHEPGLLHWDGATLSEDRISCHPGEGVGLSLGRSEVIAVTTYDNGEYMEFREARRSPKGTWSCTDQDTQELYLGVGEEMLRVSAVGWPDLGGHALPIADVGKTWSLLSAPHLAGRAADDVWVRLNRNDVLHWNGVVWEDRSPALSSVEDLHVSTNGAVWIAGNYDNAANGSENGHGEAEEGSKGGRVVLRWDPAAQTWVCFPTPVDFHARHVRGGSGEEVWLLGEKEIYHWDGKAFQRAVTPTPHLTDAWLAPTGELWLVGWKDTEDPGGKVGLAFRTRRGGNP
ncbi:MAG: hypothetical protein U0441_22680 [Polyangiaceae bacterium]